MEELPFQQNDTPIISDFTKLSSQILLFGKFPLGATFLQTNRNNNIITVVADNSRNHEIVDQLAPC